MKRPAVMGASLFNVTLHAMAGNTGLHSHYFQICIFIMYRTGFDRFSPVNRRQTIMDRSSIPHVPKVRWDTVMQMYCYMPSVMHCCALCIAILVFIFQHRQYYKDIDSKDPVTENICTDQSPNYSVVNVDSSICLEAPKIKKYSDSMWEVIAGILNITTDDVSVKLLPPNAWVL